MHKVFWLTGLPCSGKTTIANELARRINAEILDGDNLRYITNNKDFSFDGRKKHMLAAAELAYRISKYNSVVVALVSPIKSVREEIKKQYPNMIEIYVRCSIEECMRRDVKGMYKLAKEGKIKDFTGVDSPYEEPDIDRNKDHSHTTLVDTELLSVSQCADIILERHYAKGQVTSEFSPLISKRDKLADVNGEIDKRLISNAIYTLREVRANYKNPVVLWAGGKDSTATLHLIRQAFPNCENPFTVMFIDTGFKYRETYNFMDAIAKEWKLNFIVEKNEDAVMKRVSPESHSCFECCNLLKTKPLKDAIKKHGFDAVIVSIRWDEEGVRGKDEYYSKRKDPEHIRVHPIIGWSEADIWRYTKQFNVPYNCLYDRLEHGNLEYRSIGCYQCTKPILLGSKSERAGRKQDKEGLMEDLRKIGYM